MEETARRFRNAEPHGAAPHFGWGQWFGFGTARAPRTTALGKSLAVTDCAFVTTSLRPATGDPGRSHPGPGAGLSARRPVHTSLPRSVWVQRAPGTGRDPGRGGGGDQGLVLPACRPVCRAVGSR